MEIALLDYIKKLSLDDKKTLSQKALKVAEESGELAKVVLPFDNDVIENCYLERKLKKYKKLKIDYEFR